MLERRRLLAFIALTAVVSAPSRDALAQHPDGAALVRLLGPRALKAFAPPGSPGMGALVTLPPGTRASDVGLVQAAPGFARLWGSPATIVAFADAHPGMPVEVAPPLHMLLDTARVYVTASLANDTGMDGTGVLVGVADTGLDVTHPDFIDSQGKTRVAWLLDLSAPPIGIHPALEQQYGTTDSSGNLVAGAVWAAADINALLVTGQPSQLSQLPQDEIGHGTLVASCAASNGEHGRSAYLGVAPNATLVIARVYPKGGSSVSNDEVLRGVSFLFDRADDMHQPIVVNFSSGSDFGPHDGTMSWEQALASHVGPDSPGHAFVASAGNSGSIVDAPVHENVFVQSGTELRVPLTVASASQDGSVQVWVAMHAGATMSVGLDGPDGTWIGPVGVNDSAGKTASAYTAGIYNGSTPSGSPVPAASNGAVVVWQGAFPAGTYYVTLSGTGTADLYEQGTGDAQATVGWTNAVRESTITLPATNASIIAVGCSINKVTWRNIDGYSLGPSVPLLDAVGATPEPGGMTRDPVQGEPCWFSSAGPTLTGVQKPEILAPGGAIVGALSQQAIPPVASSIFTNPSCPNKTGTAFNPDCQQVDALHAASFGTSFSSPLVSGAIAILFQRDPTLTQSDIVAALQGGAHSLRGPSSYEDQGSVGELDVLGAATAAERLRNPVVALPVAAQSWLTLGADVYLADGSTPMQAIFELRGASTGTGAASPADGFADGRFVANVLVDGLPYAGGIASIARRGPGVWLATVQLPAGLGGNNLTVGATFDGSAIVAAKSIPIATDAWNADYPPSIAGGCVAAGREGATQGAGGVLLIGVMVGWGRRRRRPVITSAG
jgi:subtilisin family serine protease